MNFKIYCYDPKQFGNKMFVLKLIFRILAILIHNATLLMRIELHFILQIASFVS